MVHGYKCIRAVAQGTPLGDESEYKLPSSVEDARKSGGLAANYQPLRAVVKSSQTSWQVDDRQISRN